MLGCTHSGFRADPGINTRRFFLKLSYLYGSIQLNRVLFVIYDFVMAASFCYKCILKIIPEMVDPKGGGNLEP